MNHFAISLQRDILQPLSKPWGAGVNPLVLIGLTEAILDLGLSEQELHATVRSYARQLSAQVHPDRGLAHSESQQKEIIGAFNAIEEFENFRACLTEFKNTRAEDRHEIGLLRAQLQRMRERFAGIEDEQRALAEQKKSIQEFFEAEQQKAATIAQNAEANLAERREAVDVFQKNLRENLRKIVKARAERATADLRRELRMRERQLLQREIEAETLHEDVSLRSLCRDTVRWWRARVGFG